MADEVKPELSATPPAPAVEAENHVVLLEPACDLVERVVKVFEKDATYAIYRASSENEAIQLLKQFSPAMVLLSCYAKTEIIRATVLLKTLQGMTRAGMLKSVVVTKLQDPRLMDSFQKLGCSEYVLDKISDYSFSYKLNLHLKGLRTKRQKAKKELELKKGGSGGPANAGSGGKRSRITGETKEAPALALAEDVWLIRGSKPKKMGLQWVLDLEGPDPSTGEWVQISDGKVEKWGWKPKGSTADPKTDGWDFSGQKPVYSELEKKWKFVSTEPDLSFKKAGKKEASKVAVDDKGNFVIALDSEQAKANVEKSRQEALDAMDKKSKDLRSKLKEDPKEAAEIQFKKGDKSKDEKAAVDDSLSFGGKAAPEAIKNHESEDLEVSPEIKNGMGKGAPEAPGIKKKGAGEDGDSEDEDLTEDPEKKAETDEEKKPKQKKSASEETDEAEGFGFGEKLDLEEDAEEEPKMASKGMKPSQQELKDGRKGSTDKVPSKLGDKTEDSEEDLSDDPMELSDMGGKKGPLEIGRKNLKDDATASDINEDLGDDKDEELDWKASKKGQDGQNKPGLDLKKKPESESEDEDLTSDDDPEKAIKALAQQLTGKDSKGKAAGKAGEEKEGFGFGKKLDLGDGDAEEEDLDDDLEAQSKTSKKASLKENAEKLKFAPIDRRKAEERKRLAYNPSMSADDEDEDLDETPSLADALKARNAEQAERKKKKAEELRKSQEEDQSDGDSEKSGLSKLLSDRKLRREELKNKESSGKDGDGYGKKGAQDREGSDRDSKSGDGDEEGGRDGRAGEAMEKEDLEADDPAQEKKKEDSESGSLLPFLICLADRLSRREEVPKVPVWLISEINKKVKAETLTVLKHNVKSGKAQVIAGNQKNLPIGKEIPMPNDLTGDINQLESLVPVPCGSAKTDYYLLVEGRVSARPLKAGDQELVFCALDHLGRLFRRAG